MPTPFYFTTPIYYVNDVPHLGTAYTTIVTDAVRRYHLLRGEDTRMLTGTDEHGLKLEREAIERGMTPQAFVDQMSERFRAAWPQLNVMSVDYKDFIRTTDADHKAFVQELWKKVEARGNVYLGAYEDWYCVGCESFKTEKELLPGNLCPLHPNKPVERVKEETYFFKLKSFQEQLLAFYEKNPLFIQPESRRNEVISFVEGGLRDLSVSRTSFSWGIPVPGNPKHVMYVWFDALANYMSALGDARGKYWPPNGKVFHLVGKDILRFHAVYWPAFLLAAGYREDELPTQIFAHGFLTVDGQKMSKSLRNAVDPLRIAKELGADVLRYHLLRAIAFGQDGDFDHAALIERYNADLGKNLGNLLSRTLGLCAKMTDTKWPADGDRGSLETELLANAKRLSAEAAASWGELAVHRALEATWEISSAANQYVDRAAPWAEAKKGNTARVEAILVTLLTVLEGISVMMWPAMPMKSDEMRAQLGLPALRLGGDLWPAFAPEGRAGHILVPTGSLFPTFDKDAEKAMLDKLAPPKAPTAEATAVVNGGSKTEPKTDAGESSAAITYDQFASVDLRVGVVKTCEKVPKKDKLLLLTVDIGEPSPRTIVAGLALTFTPEALVGRRVVVVANLAPRDFGKGLVSHGMLLATGPSEALHLATVTETGGEVGDVNVGARLK